MSTASCFRVLLRQLTKSYPDLPALMFSHSLIPVWRKHAPASPALTAIRPMRVIHPGCRPASR